MIVFPRGIRKPYGYCFLFRFCGQRHPEQNYAMWPDVMFLQALLLSSWSLPKQNIFRQKLYRNSWRFNLNWSPSSLLLRRSPVIRVRLAVPSCHVIMSRSANEDFAVVEIPSENVTMPDGHVCPDHFRGWLLKWTNYIKGYQKRWFVLSNGLLSYYRYWV